MWLTEKALGHTTSAGPPERLGTEDSRAQVTEPGKGAGHRGSGELGGTSRVLSHLGAGEVMLRSPCRGGPLETVCTRLLWTLPRVLDPVASRLYHPL